MTKGLGDLFVVRTAGHVVDLSVLGSLEFGVAKLKIPLIVVLGHDSCGAITAAMESVASGDMPGGFVRDIVERVMPSVIAARRRHTQPSAEDVEREHIRHTTALLADRSNIIAEAIAAGRLAIVGAQYVLTEGEARLVCQVGDIGHSPEGEETS